MRVVGGGMIIAGCLGLGLWYRMQLQERLKTLWELVRMLELFMGEVRYGRTTLPECCKQLAMRLPAPYGEALEKIYEDSRKKEGSSFAQSFRERMNQAFARLPVKEADKESFFQFLELGNCVEGKMQLRGMEQSKELLEERIAALHAECEKQGQLAVSLGALGGILLVVVLS